MRLTKLAQAAGIECPQGADINVTGFAIDNRKVAPGTVFGAFQGSQVNGEEIGSSDQWATHVYHFDAPCGDGNVYAIHGIDTGGPAAIIASVENCGHTTITSPAWKCVSENP